MDRTDEELDRDWQPSGRRPQSTIARSFSQELMDIFRIENSLTDLDEQVSEKKRKVNRNTQELASLEKRLREMEERLKNPNQSRAPLPQVQQQQDQDQSFQSLDVAVKDDQKARSRPGTARAAQQAPSAGNMPPTPGGSEGE
ncbi:hypothetical protein EDB81DRAFT_492016 [Dactylonectria macrodidyma]|uniref:Uncharacterized protein n=1 Tax=Dactylonectria macrodidyma TaxID=307937 RepID=A0A9P9J6I6_9HYPO|nr:hypothetical protein EDB81DRAFT_492016 [Dactylonectria macrodidyma]